MIYGDVDPKTGRQLYKPEVGRAPKNMNRNREGLSIGEYLYTSGVDMLSRKEAELEAKRREERAAANTAHSLEQSKKMYQSLKAKRFQQIFDYLDEGNQGVLDLVGLVRMPTAHMDNLDTEVREDVERAAEIHARACDVPLWPKDSPAGTEHTPDALAGLPTAPVVDILAFSELMEEGLLRHRKPRAYLVPSPSSKYQPNHSFKPQINARSKALAAKIRPPELPYHEVLHHNAEQTRARIEKMRQDLEEARMQPYTFQPQLNTPVVNGRPVEGRALRAAGTTSRSCSVFASSMTSPRMQSHNEVASSQEQLEEFEALERQVLSTLEHCSLGLSASDTVAQQQQAVMDANSAAGTPAPVGQQMADALRGSVGKGVHQVDLHATELMLLNMLTDNNLEQDAEVLDALHSYIEQASAKTGKEAPVEVHISSRRNTKEGGNTNTVNMFVYPEPAGARHTASAMEDLASSLEQWDHNTDPTLASVH